MLFGLGEEGLVDGVVLDDVDEIGGHLAVEADEFVGVFEAVVEIFEEDVFEGDHAVALALVIFASGGEFGQRILAVHGHDFVANGVGGAVERNGESKLERFARELADLGR